MSVKALYRAVAGAGLVALLGAGLALAAAPLPQVAKAYTTNGYKHNASLALIVSASNPKRLIAGPKVPPTGSSFVIAAGSIKCPKAKLSPGAAKGAMPFALFGFPGATLKLKHGRYGFSVSQKLNRAFVFASSVKPFTLTVKFTGTVTSSKAIAGTLTVHGGPCGVKRPIPYTVKLSKDPVAPGA